MKREKGLIIDGKMLSDFNRFGKEIWKKIPPVTHPFVTGDVVEYFGECYVVIKTDSIQKKYPYETLSTLQICINLFSLEKGTYNPVKFWFTSIPQESHAKLKKTGTASPEKLSAILDAKNAREDYYNNR